MSTRIIFFFNKYITPLPLTTTTAGVEGRDIPPPTTILSRNGRCRGQGRDGRDGGLSPRTTDQDQKTTGVVSSWATAVCPSSCVPRKLNRQVQPVSQARLMTTSIRQCPADDLNTLIASKSSIEEEIESQAEILRTNNSTLDSPLTDGDGFPRPDIDIWAVRHARVRIIRLRNDLSSLMDKIAMALERVHTSQSAGVTATDRETPLPSLLPFAKVDAVAPHSPAQVAVSSHLTLLPFLVMIPSKGLRPGDLIIKFGPLTAENLSDSLHPIAQEVERNENVIFFNKLSLLI